MQYSLKSNGVSTTDQNADMRNIMPEILNQSATEVSKVNVFSKRAESHSYPDK